MIEPFKPEHLEGVVFDFDESEKPQVGFMGDIRQRANLYNEHGITMSWFGDSGLLGVGGVVEFWRGCGEGWILLTPEGRRKPLALYKDMKFFVNYLFDNECYRRIQCSVLMGYKAAHRTVLKLGFVPEGMMYRYGPNGENFMRYARIG